MKMKQTLIRAANEYNIYASIRAIHTINHLLFIEMKILRNVIREDECFRLTN